MRTRYRLFRLCGFSALAAVALALRVPFDVTTTKLVTA